MNDYLRGETLHKDRDYDKSKEDISCSFEFYTPNNVDGAFNSEFTLYIEYLCNYFLYDFFEYVYTIDRLDLTNSRARARNASDKSNYDLFRAKIKAIMKTVESNNDYCLIEIKTIDYRYGSFFRFI